MIRANDADNDWIFGIGANAYKRDNAAIAQDIKTKLQEWRGDCFFNLPYGIDWLNRFSDSNTDLLEEEIRSAITRIDGVVGVSFLSVLLVDRELTLNYTVQTVFSEDITESINI